MIDEKFQYQAALTPHRPAVVDEHGPQLTYRELAERVARLAQQLRAKGVSPDDRVAVCMHRSVDLLVSMLAIFESGGCYVPIDPGYPRERRLWMLRHAQPRILIAGPEQLDLTVDGIETIAPTDDVIISAASSLRGHTPEHLAYIVYTSGSTGSPKGVAMPHRGLSRLIEWQIEDGPRGLRTLQFTPICFDVTFQEVLSTLCSGGELVLALETIRQDPEQLLETIEQRSIERLFLPYTALQQLASAASRTGRIPHSLQHVITAGEQLIITPEIAHLFASLPQCRLDNQYGPTETHLVTRYTLPCCSDWSTLPPIGQTPPGVFLYCLDEDLQPVATDEPGELYVAGEGLAREYWNDSESTARYFVPDPFRSERAGRMYRTGDIGRIRKDGNAEFLGRTDDQIKVRGFRVEPGEVEAMLTSHPRVRQTSVGLRRIADGVEALVAYIVAESDPPSAAELLAHVRERLPDYMSPARFVFLNSLPLTATGKVDRRKLATETELPSPASLVPDASKTLEETLRSIWIRVLGHDEFGSDDDFFDVGGDSLLATWVVAELGLALGREVKLSLLLDDSTISGIAANLESLAAACDAGKSLSEAVTLRPGPSNRVLYLIHPLGGELLSYRELARCIRSPLRVLGLRWQSPDAGKAMPLEGMAAAHFALLRSIQPLPPYLIAGWSFGGVLAYEVAQQLRAAELPVEFLGLIDANPIRDSTTGVLARETPLFHQLEAILASLESGRDSSEVRAMLAEPGVNALMGGISEGVKPEHLRTTLQVTLNSMRAAMDYRAAPYRGAIDLFQPEEAAPEMQAQLYDELRRLTKGELSAHMVPGDHYSMLQSPHVEKLAQALDAALTASRSRTESAVEAFA